MNEQDEIACIAIVKYAARAQMIVNALRAAGVPFDALTARIFTKYCRGAGQMSKLDHAVVSDLARRISDKLDSLVELRQAAEHASSELNSAQCELSNLRSEFTRLVNEHLDHSLVRNPNPPINVS